MFLMNLFPLAVLVILIGVAKAQQHIALTGVQTGIKNGAVPYRRDIRDLRSDNTAWSV